MNWNRRPAGETRLKRMIEQLRSGLTEHFGEERANHLMDHPEEIEDAISEIEVNDTLSELLSSLNIKVS